ncbi:REST corepressor [Eumeta japonica]|uniref:REST corepressor n=1 Tax=Eumeta variegata TaxID=151549 RepID=A0A4C1SCK4_EUMVA|nr:REST corepressor [Eumeta japonica]
MVLAERSTEVTGAVKGPAPMAMEVPIPVLMMRMIRVGRDYQAVCPELEPIDQRRPELIADRALLVWSPTSDISDTKLKYYYSWKKTRARTSNGYGQEKVVTTTGTSSGKETLNLVVQIRNLIMTRRCMCNICVMDKTEVDYPPRYSARERASAGRRVPPHRSPRRQKSDKRPPAETPCVALRLPESDRHLSISKIPLKTAWVCLDPARDVKGKGGDAAGKGAPWHSHRRPPRTTRTDSAKPVRACQRGCCGPSGCGAKQQRTGCRAVFTSITMICRDGHRPAASATAHPAQSGLLNQGEAMLKAMDREIISLKRQVRQSRARSMTCVTVHKWFRYVDARCTHTCAAPDRY